MEQKVLLRTNIIISLIIILGFIAIVMTNYKTLEKVIKDDIKNISKLTSSTIYARIDNELTKPIFVSQTMANDTFLKQWLKDEIKHKDDLVYQEQIKNYLQALRFKYDYDSVFMVSNQTNIYYHFAGINKIIKKENKHDIWYYNFLKSNLLYDLDVDQDEVNKNSLTVFVNCRIEDERGNLLGVVGVGVKMNRLQQLLKYYEDEFNLKTFLVNKNGLIQIHTDPKKIEKINFFQLSEIKKIKNKIINNRQDLEMHWYSNQLDTCLITRYISNMDWYLIVEKDTQSIKDSFYMLVKQDLLLMGIILSLLLALSTYVISQYNKKIIQLSNIDILTGLPNEKLFTAYFAEQKKKAIIHNGGSLFIVDIDKFKSINDTKGHIFGNKVIKQVSRILQDYIANQGLVIRWGGDEFCGIVLLPLDKAYQVLENMRKEFSDFDFGNDVSITVSIGLTSLDINNTLENLIDQADKALYDSKLNGRNKITIFKENEI